MLVHCRFTPGIKFTGTHLYTWVERGAVRLKCLAQEHNTMSPARAWTWAARSEAERTNHEASHKLRKIVKHKKKPRFTPWWITRDRARMRVMRACKPRTRLRVLCTVSFVGAWFFAVFASEERNFWFELSDINDIKNWMYTIVSLNWS